MFPCDNFLHNNRRKMSKKKNEKLDFIILDGNIIMRTKYLTTL